jgi:ribosomal protein S18 acetylase RimI-like enzyme
MGDFAVVLRRAGVRDLDVITSLIDAAADWLRTKNTDQWAQPWPSEEDRSHRILRDLRAEKTWIAWDGRVPAATITAASEDSAIWPAETRQERAVYVCRLVVNRGHAGRALGAALLDWAGFSALRRYGARWVRVDVWTTNVALHSYYQRQGFEFYGYCEAVAEYPSAALFQKPTDRIKPTDAAMFHVAPQGT